MSNKKSITEILNFVGNDRVGRGSILPPKSNSILSEELSSGLRSQWSDSGREKAKVYVKLIESDGNDLYLTGWDGNDTFVGYEADKGLGYVPASRVLVAELDPFWNSEITLGEVRKNLDEMDSHQVADLVGRLKKCLTKRSKDRRHSEVKNFVKRFQKAVTDDKKASISEAKDAEPSDEDSNKDDDRDPKKGKRDAMMHTKANYMKQMSGPKNESFSSSLSKFRKLAESGGGPDETVKNLKREVKAKNASKPAAGVPSQLGAGPPMTANSTPTPEDQR